MDKYNLAENIAKTKNGYKNQEQCEQTEEDKEQELVETGSNGSDSDNNLSEDESMDLNDDSSSDEDYETDDGSDLDDFIVNEEDDLLDVDGNIIEGTEENEQEEKKAMEDFEKILEDLRKPKLALNPYPTLNTHWKEIEVKTPPKFTNEKDRLKWLIENKLGPNMTLEDYVKFLDEQEKESVDNYIQKTKKRKLNNSNKNNNDENPNKKK